MAREKRLIVNADDLGLHPTVNQAVDQGVRNGILTSASIMAGAEAFDGALDVVRRNPGLGVGIHLTLNGQRPVAPPDRIKTLIGEDGLLHERHVDLFRGIVLGTIRRDEVALEFEAQIRKVLDAGITPTHVDSHRHVHLFPPILSVLVPLLRRYGIGRMRRAILRAGDLRLGGIEKVGFLMVAAMGGGCARDILSPDRFFGFFESGNIDAAAVKRIVRSLGPETAELAVHPATDNEMLKARYPSWSDRHRWPCSWEKELEAVCDPSVKSLIEERRVRLVHFGSLQDNDRDAVCNPG